MLSIETMHDALETAIERAKRNDDITDLRELQHLAGYLMRPAAMKEDKETEKRFRILAASAANIRETIMRRRGDD